MTGNHHQRLTSRCFIGLLGGIVLSSLTGLSGSSFSAFAQTPADLLPPPPPQFGSPPIAPPEALPSITVPPAQQTTAPAPNVKGYRVFVPGDSALLLQQVRTVEPTAFVQNYQGRRVIQVGVFSNEANARQKLATLASQGIRAEMSDELLGPVANQPRAKGYYVVIPARRADLPQIREQAIRLGVPSHLTALRDRPLGDHLAVGPFTKRQDAEEVERYLKDKGGMDTRIYRDR
jgi:SPOR domain